MRDGFELVMGAVISLVCVALVVLGYAVGQTHIATDCKDFGAFKHGVVYECKEKSK